MLSEPGLTSGREVLGRNGSWLLRAGRKAPRRGRVIRVLEVMGSPTREQSKTAQSGRKMRGRSWEVVTDEKREEEDEKKRRRRRIGNL